MAAQLWDREHGDQRVFNQVPGNGKWLDKLVPKLTSTVQMGPLWVHLTALEAVDKAKRSKMELNATHEEQVQRLCDHLQVGAVWRWHAFLRSLLLSDQEAIIGLIGIDPKKYEDQTPVVAGPPLAEATLDMATAPPGGSSTSTTSAGSVALQNITEDTLEDFMEKKRAALMTKLKAHMGPQILTDFLSGQAITPVERDLIKNETRIHEQLEKLLDFISAGDIEKFDNFCTVMRNRKMAFIDRLIKTYFSEMKGK